jgi:hypothetical protein
MNQRKYVTIQCFAIVLKPSLAGEGLGEEALKSILFSYFLYFFKIQRIRMLKKRGF